MYHKSKILKDYLMSEKELINNFNNNIIDIWINSFGGCRSNYIRGMLKNDYRTYNYAYEMKGCHYIKPLNVKVGCGIFCYIEDVGIALSSQIKRNMTHNYIKLTNNDNIKFNISDWLDKINIQIDNWTSKPIPFPVIIINTDKILNYKNNFKEVFGITLNKWKDRETKTYINELIRYKDKIKKINIKLKNLDNFATR